jgi:hypothetical protein
MLFEAQGFRFEQPKEEFFLAIAKAIVLALFLVELVSWSERR